MKKKIIILTLIMITAIFCSCQSIPDMDEEKCAEITLEYLTEKYGKEFEIIDSYEIYAIVGRPGVTKVLFREKNSEDENKHYVAEVIPKPKKDKDKDGYYDSYEVESDNYICSVIKNFVEEGITSMLNDVGVQHYKITNIEIYEINAKVGMLATTNQKNILRSSYYDFSHNYTLMLSVDMVCPMSQNIEEFKGLLEQKYDEYYDDDDVFLSFHQYEDEEYDEVIRTGKETLKYKLESIDLGGN